MGANQLEGAVMPKFILLKHYAGDGPPATEWTPAEFDTHIRFQHALVKEIADAGELVGAEGLAGPDAARVVTYGGPGAAPVVTDGPFAESKEFLAGYYMIDVESAARAYEIAAKASGAPGPGGKPIYERIEVREVMGAPPTSDS
jgi:hypothetical protein